ncbi:hypothetical protein [Saccharopolyspora erythraea]|uniref:MmyB family transcriptional regulator n=1 Tax=Saccharopolyspora erythraea TaxID=1836 RepID=UPI001E3A85EF
MRLGTRASSGAEEFGRIAAARLRAAGARYPCDEPLARLLVELRANSEEFRVLWDTHPVHAPGHRTKVLPHPEAGRLRVNCDVLPVHDDQQIVFITAEPGSRAERVFRHLLESRRG